MAGGGPDVGGLAAAADSRMATGPYLVGGGLILLQRVSLPYGWLAARCALAFGGPAMTTTRETFGTALVALAHLYDVSEKRGDMRRAAQYSAAVDLVLGAWPTDSDQDRNRGSSPTRNSPKWPAREPTLVGLGILE
jgi:hypothetical protein